MWPLLIILVIIFFLFVRPAYRVWKAVDQARRQAREMNDAFRRAAGIDPEQERRRQARQKQTSRKGGWSEPVPKKKKIDPATGEYIRFKEITVEERSATASSTEASDPEGKHRAVSVETEEQIVDVKWEELK